MSPLNKNKNKSTTLKQAMFLLCVPGLCPCNPGDSGGLKIIEAQLLFFLFRLFEGQIATRLYVSWAGMLQSLADQWPWPGAMVT